MSKMELNFARVNRPGVAGHLPGWQRHHLIPLELVRHRQFCLLFDTLRGHGFAIDDFCSNGVMLPGTEEEALRSGLPLHRGPHPLYTRFAAEHVEAIRATLGPDASPGDLHRALARLRRLQRALAEALHSRRKRAMPVLSRQDPARRVSCWNRLTVQLEFAFDRDGGPDIVR